MSGFQLDTSGFVGLSIDGKADGDPMEHTAWTFASLTPFQQGYVEAMFASTFPLGWIDCAESADYHVPAFSDLAPATLARIIGDCERVEAIFPGASLTSEDGRRVWEHRKVGFPGPLATDDALRADLPPLTPYLGEDGLIYFREAA